MAGQKNPIILLTPAVHSMKLSSPSCLDRDHNWNVPTPHHPFKQHHVIEDIMFRPLDPSDKELDLRSPTSVIEEKRKATSLPHWDSTDILDDCSQDERFYEVTAQAKRFKLPCSSVIRLKMRPSSSSVFQDTKPMTSCETRRCIGLQHDDERPSDSVTSLAFSTLPCVTPQETCRHYIQTSPPVIKPSSSFQDVEASNPFPLNICLPMF
jgi:hypothetical protein